MDGVFRSKGVELTVRKMLGCPCCGQPVFCSALMPCGHRGHYNCIQKYIKKKRARRCPTCNKLFRTKPEDLPTDPIFNDLSRFCFPDDVEKQPCTREEADLALAASIREAMYAQKHKISRDDYWDLLTKELSVENLHQIKYCKCSPPLVCVRRGTVNKNPYREYYGCPMWNGKEGVKGCGFFQFTKVQTSQEPATSMAPSSSFAACIPNNSAIPSSQSLLSKFTPSAVE